MRFWLQFNLVLLLIYLGFFHACNVVQWPMILLLGVGFGSVAAWLVWRSTTFLSSFERLAYMAIPLDILLEGMIPFHSGYSFYYCALAFWGLFVSYRIWLEFKTVREAVPDAQPTPSQSGTD